VAGNFFLRSHAEPRTEHMHTHLEEYCCDTILSRLLQEAESSNHLDPELVDPNPDVRALFVQFDREYFWSTLGSVEVLWSPKMTLCGPVCFSGLLVDVRGCANTGPGVVALSNSARNCLSSAQERN
jgi:hypothetical protein